MLKSLSSLDHRYFDDLRPAFFFDFDGTLVEIADRPDLVQIAPATKDTLARLSAALDGAIAVITGRELGDVDKYLMPLRLPIAGGHGFSRRSIDGSTHISDVDGDAFQALNDRLEQYVEGNKGLLLERKSGSVALHFRARPELEQQSIHAMNQAVRGMTGIHVLHGKMIVEAKAESSNKGSAINAFLAEPPFIGRTPFFAGDDVTDEDAFAVVNARRGITVKIGPGPTLAHYHARTTSEFLDWLQCLSKHMEQEQRIEQS